MSSPREPGRRSIRLPFYDYASPGAYFVTVCVEGRTCILAAIQDAQAAPTAIGAMVEETWRNVMAASEGVSSDVFVVMPNHIHGIVVIESGANAVSLSALLRRFKSFTTVAYRRMTEAEGRPIAGTRLWQRNYFERVIVRRRNGTPSATTLCATRPSGAATPKTPPRRNKVGRARRP
ncbi:MAG: transposase, partial [Candidatus Methylomirabilis sp.]|nr:transposase [Deltaproteobacteria bacterium]